MLSIGKLTAGAEEYYLSTVAKGREEYYVGSGEAPGTWLGSGTPALDLAGQVEGADLRLVLAGMSPGECTPLSRHFARQDRVAGFDLTFSAPKSVSVLWALGDEEVTKAVQAAHDHAVTEALAYMERHAALARRGAGGTERIETSGFVAAAFRHRTSRNGDPQLHTHVLIANAVKGADGQWSSVDAGPIYNQAQTAGYAYQASLRHHLVTTLGVTLGPVVKGSAEIDGVDRVLTKAFSSRRQEIEAHLANTGEHSSKAAEIATLATRDAKDPNVAGASAESLRERWHTLALDLGADPAALGQLVGPGRDSTVDPDQEAVLVAQLLGPEGLTAHASTFARRDVVRAVASALPDGAQVATLEAIADRAMAHPEVVSFSAVDKARELYRSTTELLAVEDAMLAASVARRHVQAAIVDEEIVEQTLERHDHLADEQAEMVRSLTADGQGVSVVVGKAGAGKTTALAATAEAFRSDGYRVTGTALAARAAKELEDGAGIESTTLAKRFRDLENGNQVLTERDVIVVDEAGMVGTRDLARLLNRAGEAKAKVILVGDPRQLPEIMAGGAYGALAECLGAVTLTENRRQRERWERVALDHLRDGEVQPALAAYESHDRVHVEADMATTRQALVDDWFDQRDDEDDDLMLAVANSDVGELNHLARERLRTEGLLGDDLAVPGSFAVGDRVVALRNERRLGVLNGTTATVTGADQHGLHIETKDGERVLPDEYLEEGHLAHGYAMTVHKAQGATYDRAYVLAGQALTREAGYVAMSRARVSTHLYVPGSTIDDGREGDDHDAQEPLSMVARRLSASRAQRLATSYRDDEPELEFELEPDLEPALELEPPLHPWSTQPLPPMEVDADPQEAPIPVVAAIGPRPRFLDEQPAYDDVAERITRYRERHGVTDEDDPLGPRPGGLAAGILYDHTAKVIAEYQKRLERTPDDDNEPEPLVRERSLGRELLR